jgi:hypothetical protein
MLSAVAAKREEKGAEKETEEVSFSACAAKKEA